MPLTREELEYVKKLLGREPSRAELVILEAVWSEHCSYKSSKRWLRLLPTKAPWVVVGPGRDAGAVRLWDDALIAFRVESHNHPSAVDPYNGAATGIGGIVRDVLSVGGKPIALLDILYMGDPGDEHGDWLASGIVRGISDYGNRIGVPTVAGETWRHPWYNRYPLVNVACVGFLRPEWLLEGRVEPGDPIVIAGSPTGRDGILGSAFASKPLEEDIAAVQVGNPFIEKLLIDAIGEAVEAGVLRHVKDLGGGGLPVAVGETAHASNVGAVIHLERLHLREAGMTPEEILASESQERMLLVPKPGMLDRLLRILERHGLEYSVIGEFTAEKRLRVYYRGDLVADLPMEVYDGPPEPRRVSERPRDAPDERLVRPPEPSDYREALVKLFSSPRVRSKRYVYERYDWGVQGRSVAPPGYADAAVLWLHELGDRRGVAVAAAGNPRYTRLDPYRGAALALEQAYRSIVAVGGEPLAAVDNVNAGNPEKPSHYWFFEMMVRGLAWAARELGVPIVGGNVSLYNEDPETGMVPPVTSVVAVGRVWDVSRIFYRIPRRIDDQVLLMVGSETLPELGGSEYLEAVHGRVEGAPPEPRPSTEKRLEAFMARFRTVVDEHGAWSDVAVSDVGLGGVAVLAARLAAMMGVGVSIDACRVPSKDARLHEVLFSETQGRLLITAPRDVAEELVRLAESLGLAAGIIGELGGDVVVYEACGRRLAAFTVEEVSGMLGKEAV